jgi:hypothetical protein
MLPSHVCLLTFDQVTFGQMTWLQKELNKTYQELVFSASVAFVSFREPPGANVINLFTAVNYKFYVTKCLALLSLSNLV